ncbi:hypothetical protein N3Z16_10060 (plasmid) [Candidatus Megaera polyxenophila]|nr:hypothetical protein N3Z16_10060 [Candidatus Megaera polyxenophila]
MYNLYWPIGNIAAKKAYKKLCEQYFVVVDLSGVQAFVIPIF